MRKILVCGSIAFDNVMDFPGHFQDQIVPDKLHTINISFLVNTLKKVRGGTAPNISYNLALLGEKPVIFGSAGIDFAEYQEWLDENNVDTSKIKIIEDLYTASCFITTDLANNQLTGFYPGAMSMDKDLSLKDTDLTDVAMVIIAPTEPSAMIRWTQECKELNIPYMFDPGMQIPRFTGEELIKGIMGSEIAIFNEYEYTLMLQRTGLSEGDMLENVKIVVETLGAKGVMIRTKTERVYVPAAQETRVVNPTGVGDAFRAGVLKGYFEGASLEQMGKFGNISAVYAIEHAGATEHKFSMDEYMKRFNENYTHS